MFWPQNTKARSNHEAGFSNYSRQRPTLPRTFARSTIGGGRLNFRVRNGNGCDPAPMTTGKLDGEPAETGLPDLGCLGSDRVERGYQPRRIALPIVPDYFKETNDT